MIYSCLVEMDLTDILILLCIVLLTLRVMSAGMLEYKSGWTTNCTARKLE